MFNTIDRDYFGDEWFIIRAPHDTDDLIPYNKKVVIDFADSYIESFSIDIGHIERTDLQKHLVAEIPLRDGMKFLLNKLKFTRESDSQTYSSLRGVINRYVEENPNENCLVYFMSSKVESNHILQTTRKRRLNQNDGVQQLFQGEQPTSNGKFRKGEVYPGDRNIRNENMVSIQIHRLNLTDTNGNEIIDENGSPLYEDLANIAVWIPETIGKDIIRQPDNI